MEHSNSLLSVEQSSVYLNYLIAFSNPTVFCSNARRFDLHKRKVSSTTMH